jgi:predicted RNase H-like HicB family nuclease
MNPIILDDLDPNIIEWLKSRAQKHGNSLQAEVKSILQQLTVEVPELQGLYANAPTLESCRDELKQSLEEWIVLGLQLGHNIPQLERNNFSIIQD